jgi:hypothetical protein
MGFVELAFCDSGGEGLVLASWLWSGRRRRGEEERGLVEWFSGGLSGVEDEGRV